MVAVWSFPVTGGPWGRRMIASPGLEPTENHTPAGATEAARKVNFPPTVFRCRPISEAANPNLQLPLAPCFLVKRRLGSSTICADVPSAGPG